MRNGSALRLFGERLVDGVEHGVERLAQLGAVAVKGIGFEHEPPTQRVGIFDVFDRRRVGHVDRFGNGTGDERLGGGHHANVRLRRQIALALACRICWRSRKPG